MCLILIIESANLDLNCGALILRTCDSKLVLVGMISGSSESLCKASSTKFYQRVDP